MGARHVGLGIRKGPMVYNLCSYQLRISVALRKKPHEWGFLLGGDFFASVWA